MKSTSAGRNVWLDILRGLAAVAVVMFHLNEPIPFEASWYRNAVKLGWLGVVVFFVISGYCIHGAALRSVTVGQYFWKRATRIYPPYWISIALVLVVCLGRKMIVGVNDRIVLPHSWAGWVATFTAMVSPATSTPGVNWVYWTLANEVMFYAVTAVAVRRSKIFPLITMVLSLGACFANATLASTPGLFFLSYWPVYGAGVGVSLLSQGYRLWGMAVLFVCCGAVGYLFPISVFIVTISTAAVIMVSLTLSCDSDTRIGDIAVNRQKNTWSTLKSMLRVRTPRINNPLVQVGVISYSLYLIHVPIGCWLLVRWKNGIWATNPLLNLAYDIAICLVCIIASFGFYWIAERPSLALGRLKINSLGGAHKTPGVLQAATVIGDHAEVAPRI